MVNSSDGDLVAHKEILNGPPYAFTPAKGTKLLGKVFNFNDGFHRKTKSSRGYNSSMVQRYNSINPECSEQAAGIERDAVKSLRGP